ncbi:YfhH family protein [Halobacillus sp. Marseille-Q1614]|uniref:YfhH family protein n=1 Tax=Halobacillus sp. Marseille-Q1614 TaxID=2709134 RepID=UPI00156DB93C|nr:YfhH family protein [Halobacillus sp. Marseille-Q1614]
MEKRYSDYTQTELREEIAQLKEKALKAEQLGIVNEFAVYERKIIMAKSYMLDPGEFQPETYYEIEGDPAHNFYIEYMNGVFAWGYRVKGSGEKAGEEEEALPISMLGSQVRV